MAGDRRVHPLHVVGADLVAEAARAGVDQDRDLALAQAEGLGDRRVDDPLHRLHLDEVVARAHRAELARAALLGALGHPLGLGAGERPSGFGVAQVVLGADPVPGDQRPRALDEDAVERRALEPDGAALPRPRRHRARDLMDEVGAALAQLRLLQRQRQQAHAAVDVVADAARRDDPVGRQRRGDAADREAVALVHVGHRQRRLDDPRQRRHVLQLLQRAVARGSRRGSPRRQRGGPAPACPPARSPGSPKAPRRGGAVMSRRRPLLDLPVAGWAHDPGYPPGVRSHLLPLCEEKCDLAGGLDRRAGQPGLEPGIAGFGDRCLSQLGHCPSGAGS